MRAASTALSSVASSRPHRIFSITVPVKRWVSWAPRPGSGAGHPFGWPDVDTAIGDDAVLDLIKRLTRLVMVVLPAPVEPTKGDLLPGFAKTVTSWRICLPGT